MPRYFAASGLGENMTPGKQADRFHRSREFAVRPLAIQEFVVEEQHRQEFVRLKYRLLEVVRQRSNTCAWLARPNYRFFHAPGCPAPEARFSDLVEALL